LLAVAESRFLVTARHLLDDLHPDDELVLYNAMEGSIFTLTESLYPKNARYDVTVLELRFSDIALFEKMRFFSLEDVDVERPRPHKEVYSLIGYPQELAPATHRDGEQSPLVLNALISSARVHASKFEPQHQFLLDNDPLLCRDERWAPSTTPDLHGVSGAPVFQVTKGDGEILLNERARWVGVECGFFLVDGHQLIKTTGIEIPLSLIATSRPTLRPVIETQLAGQTR